MHTQILELLNEWRYFPKYQLERHVDVFFGLYIHQILEEKFERKYFDTVFPEFPISKQLLIQGHPGNDVINSDFCLITSDKNIATFVELKTDHRSLRDSQDIYYENIKTFSFNDILEKLLNVVKVSSIKYKYLPLLSSLQKVGVINIDLDFYERYKTENRVYANKYLKPNTIISKSIKCEVEYILPKNNTNKENTITFEELSSYPFIDKEFRIYLKKWCKPLKDDIANMLSI